MRHDRMTVLAAMIDQGVIPVFHHANVALCKAVIQACADGGAKRVEFNNHGDFAAFTFLDVTRHFAKADPSAMTGVGSVVDAPTAGLPINAGATFVVGPARNPDVAKVCDRRKTPYSPSCGSTRPESPKRWFKPGAACVGLASNLISKARLDVRDFTGIDKKVRETIALARSIRGK